MVVLQQLINIRDNQMCRRNETRELVICIPIWQAFRLVINLLKLFEIVWWGYWTSTSWTYNSFYIFTYKLIQWQGTDRDLLEYDIKP